MPTLPLLKGSWYTIDGRNSASVRSAALTLTVRAAPDRHTKEALLAR
jgi:hypothetical protein